MASPTTQHELQISTPNAPVVSNTHRWVDLALVLSVAFAGVVLSSISLAFHRIAREYSNARLSLGILQEAIALSLFLILFKRQGRRLQDIGLGFRWTDLPKSLGLLLAAFATMWAMTVAIPYIYFLVTLRTLASIAPASQFSTSSLWLMLPLLLLNPFFEEILVRGYLMTEMIDLRKSVALAAAVSLGLQTSYHLYYGVFGATIVGCGLAVFAIYYAKSRRLMPIVLAHMLWDFTTVFSKLHHQ
jgi:membrane protease YdiL (CAAX protease family)